MSNTKHYFWSAINRIGVQVIGFIGNILIARILSPDDYGLIAMLSIILGISWNLTESGFADSLIRKQDVNQKDFGTILTHNVSMSIILYIILYFSAPYIAQFFDRDELTIITRIISLSIVFKALTVTEFTRMRKELEFKRFAVIQLLGNLFSIVLAFLAANNGFGYYALVIQTLALSIFNILLLIILNKWIPVFHFNLKRYKEMRKFSNNMLFSYFSNQIGQNIYSVFIGKFQSSVPLGFFNQATKVNDASFQGLNSIIVTTSYPIIAKEKDKINRKIKYEELINTFLYIHFFTSFFILGSAADLIPFIFGSQWSTSSFYLQLITLSTLFFPLMTINANIAKTENKTNTYRNLTFLRNGLTLISLLFTFHYSMTTILIGLIISRYISVLIDISICGKEIDLHFMKQIKISSIQIIAPLVAMLSAYYISTYSDMVHIKLLGFCTMYFILFVLLNYIIKNKVQQTAFSKLKSKIKL